MEIRIMTEDDKDFVMSIDRHVSETGYRNRVFTKSGYVLWEGKEQVGIMSRGYKITLISTQVDETAQHLYRKLGYVDCGGLIFQNTPFDQPMEMFFRKVL